VLIIDDPFRMESHVHPVRQDEDRSLQDDRADRSDAIEVDRRSEGYFMTRYTPLFDAIAKLEANHKP
jgi:hypothetical protein